MKQLSLILCVAALFAAAVSADAQGPTLSADGLGPLKFGMPIEQVQHILKYEPPYNFGGSGDCMQFSTAQLEPLGLSFVVDQKRLVRINVDFGTDQSQPSYKTDTGIGLGSAEEDLLKAYPAAVIKHNPADPSWHTIVVETPDHKHGLIFETNGKTVKSLRAGETGMITLPEACN